jgi:hypothetical protein
MQRTAKTEENPLELPAMRRRLPNPIPQTEWMERVEQLAKDADQAQALPRAGDAMDWLEARRTLAQRFVQTLWPILSDPVLIATCCRATLAQGQPTLLWPGRGGLTGRCDAVVAVMSQLVMGDLVADEEERGGEGEAAVELFAAQAKERQREAGGDRKSEAVRSVSADLREAIPPQPTQSEHRKSTAQAAKAVGASPRAVEQAAPVPVPSINGTADGSTVAATGRATAGGVAASSLVMMVVEALAAPEPAALVEEDEPAMPALDQLLTEMRGGGESKPKRGQPEEVACQACGTLFTRWSRRGTYCSSRCRSLASKRRLRAVAS